MDEKKVTRKVNLKWMVNLRRKVRKKWMTVKKTKKKQTHSEWRIDPRKKMSGRKKKKIIHYERKKQQHINVKKEWKEKKREKFINDRNCKLEIKNAIGSPTTEKSIGIEHWFMPTNRIITEGSLTTIRIQFNSVRIQDIIDYKIMFSLGLFSSWRQRFLSEWGSVINASLLFQPNMACLQVNTLIQFMVHYGYAICDFTQIIIWISWKQVENGTIFHEARITQIVL